MPPNELVILTRTYDLLAWLLPKGEDFPKAYRATATQRMMDAALDFQEALFRAMAHGGNPRQKYLREASAALDSLRLYLRLAHRWQWLNDGQYLHVSAMVADIGRLLGGWIKTSSPPDKS